MEATELIAHFEQRCPLAARLASCACLPVRITPSFLRLVRLRLLQEAGTGDEADLWLSDLVESRSGAGFTLRREVRNQLREYLRHDRVSLDRLWHSVHQEHAPWLAPRARQEEELTWLLLRDPTDPAIETHWAGIVHELDEGPTPEGVARWVTRAVPEMPEGTLGHNSGRRAFHGAHLLLGDASVLGTEAQAFLDTGEFAFATRRLPRRRVFLGLSTDRFVVSPLRSIENGHEIEIPSTQPLWLQFSYESRPELPAQVLTLDDESPQVHRAALADLQQGLNLRSIDGASYRLAPASHGGDASSRQRSPRVQIEYEVELYGTMKKVHLPFVIGVLADLSGPSGREKPPLEVRKFRDFDLEIFDHGLRASRPKLSLAVPDTFDVGRSLSLSLEFERLEDFNPDRLLEQIPAVQHWLHVAKDIAALASVFEAGHLGTELLRQLLSDRKAISQLAKRTLATDEGSFGDEGALAVYRRERDEFARLWGVTNTSMHDVAYRGAVAIAQAAALFDPAMEPQPNVLFGLQATVELIYARIGWQVDAVLHHSDFQRLEATWRGLHYLVSRTQTSETLKIRVLDVSKTELDRNRVRSRLPNGNGDVLFKKIYEEEFGQFGGEPFGLLVGDFEFDHQKPDADLLRSLAELGSAAHAPFVAAASPRLLQLGSWRELDRTRDLRKIFSMPEYAHWRGLRESEEARYVGLVLPTVLAREPWRAKTWGIPGVEENTNGGDESRLSWMNGAYAMAANIARSFARHGWCAKISGLEGGGLVEGLPEHQTGDKADSRNQSSPIPVMINQHLESELARLGLMPLSARPTGSIVYFADAGSLQKPAEYDDADATANAALAAKWPYLFAACRFMHYLKCIVRDRVGSFQSPEGMQRALNEWILGYVDTEPADSSAEARAARPLQAAEIVVEPSRGELEGWTLTAYLRPHYQVEGLTVSLRIITPVPGPRGESAA